MGSPSASPPTCAPTPEARPSHGHLRPLAGHARRSPLRRNRTFQDCRGHQEEEGVEARPRPARQLLGQNVTSLAILRILNWEGCFYSLMPRNLVKFSYIGKNFDIFGSIGRMDITPVC